MLSIECIEEVDTLKFAEIELEYLTLSNPYSSHDLYPNNVTQQSLPRPKYIIIQRELACKLSVTLF